MKNLYVPEGQRLETSFRDASCSLRSPSPTSASTPGRGLTAYLNTVYFGDGAYGAEEAAQRYFGKSARDLDLSESMLAGLLRPFDLRDLEGDVIQKASPRTPRQCPVAYAGTGYDLLPGARGGRGPTPDVRSLTRRLKISVHTPFLEKVGREVEEELGPRALQLGGLRIHTTMDSDLQHAAVETSSDVLSEPDDPLCGRGDHRASERRHSVSGRTGWDQPPA